MFKLFRKIRDSFKRFLKKTVIVDNSIIYGIEPIKKLKELVKEYVLIFPSVVMVRLYEESANGWREARNIIDFVDNHIADECYIVPVEQYMGSKSVQECKTYKERNNVLIIELAKAQFPKAMILHCSRKMHEKIAELKAKVHEEFMTKSAFLRPHKKKKANKKFPYTRWDKAWVDSRPIWKNEELEVIPEIQEDPIGIAYDVRTLGYFFPQPIVEFVPNGEIETLGLITTTGGNKCLQKWGYNKPVYMYQDGKTKEYTKGRYINVGTYILIVDSKIKKDEYGVLNQGTDINVYEFIDLTNTHNVKFWGTARLKCRVPYYRINEDIMLEYVSELKNEIHDMQNNVA